MKICVGVCVYRWTHHRRQNYEDRGLAVGVEVKFNGLQQTTNSHKFIYMLYMYKAIKIVHGDFVGNPGFVVSNEQVNIPIYIYNDIYTRGISVMLELCCFGKENPR